MKFRCDRLKALRQKLGLSQHQLAVQLATSLIIVAHLEDGVLQPSADMLLRMAKVLNVSRDYLLGLIDTPEPDYLFVRLDTPTDEITSEEREVLRAYRDSTSPVQLVNLWWHKWQNSNRTNGSAVTVESAPRLDEADIAAHAESMRPPMGMRLKNRRLELGMSQDDLAKRIKSSQAHISSIERGETQPRVDTLKRLAEALGVTIDYLLS